MNEQETKMIVGIQEKIASSLCSNVEVFNSKKLDSYQEKLFHSLQKCRRFWSLKLLMVPNNHDFIHLAYWLVLGRVPDPQGELQFLSALAVDNLPRTSVLTTMLTSQEFHERAHKIGGRKILWLIHHASSILRKIPIVNKVIPLFWVGITSFERQARFEQMLLELQASQRHIRNLQLRVDDVVEYLHQKDRVSNDSDRLYKINIDSKG